MNQLNNLQAWIALCAVNDTGSMRAAADRLDTEVSNVTRLITGLEKGLGRALIKRSTRPAQITEEGRAMVEEILPIINAHQNFITKLTTDSGEMRGTIRLSVAGGLLQSLLMPILLDFKRLYPKIDFDVMSGRMIRECIDGTIDVASVSDIVTEKNLIVLPRGRSVFIPVASPSYLRTHDFPLVPEDLIHHEGFVYNGPVRSLTSSLTKGSQERSFSFGSRTLSTDILMIKKTVMDGLGIAVDLPLLHCAEALSKKELVVILDGWHRPPIPGYAVCSRANWHVKRIRVFMQWFCDRFENEFAQTEAIAREVLGEAANDYFT